MFRAFKTLSLLSIHIAQYCVAQQVSCTDLTSQAGDSSSLAITNATEVAPQTLSFALFGPYTNEVPLCRVQGNVRYGLNKSEGIELWLPPSSLWNGRYLVVGTGGFGGIIDYGTMLQQVNAGYAVAGGDSGHLFSANGNGISMPGQSIPFLQDPDETTEWIHNSVASMTPPTRSLTKIFYGRSPSHSYYAGCSTGGAQGFALAQYHPELFDGIFAGSPGNWYSHLTLSFLWNYLHAQKAFLDQATLNFITNSTLKKCDSLDGLEDGVIGDPLNCRFNISEIACAAGQARNNSKGIQCVTSAEVATYQAIRAGPSEAGTGRKVYPGFDFGSESSWLLQEAELALNFTIPILQNAVFKNLSYEYISFSFTPAELETVDSRVSPLIDSISPDLRAYKNRGKLLVTQGWADAYNAATWPIEHFEQTSAFLSSNGIAAGNASDFYRLFMIPGPIHWKNFVTCLFIAFGLFTYGYFTGIIASTLTKPNFLLYMGLVDGDGNPTPSSTGLVGATTGVYQAGGLIGTLAAGLLMDAYGRKMAFLILSVIGVIAQGILAASQNIGMFIAFRFFTGFVGYSMVVLPAVYTSELAPSHLRGFLTGLCGIWCAFGFAVSTYFGTAFYHTGAIVQWRVPLALGVLCPMIQVVGGMFLPETPRYLLAKGKDAAALAVTLKQHAIGGGEDFARAEFLQMQKQMELDQRLDASWISFITKAAVRKRGVIVIIMSFLGQSSGNLVVNNYGGILYTRLGYAVYDQLSFQCGYITTATVCSVVGSLLVDKIGRRKLMMIGLSGCALSLTLETIIVAVYADAGTNKAALGVGVAALWLFQGSYCLSVDICCFVISAELFPNHLRAKGATISFCSSVLTNLVFLQAAPTAFANIGWKFFLVFIAITIVGIVWIYFVLPEAREFQWKRWRTSFRWVMKLPSTQRISRSTMSTTRLKSTCTTRRLPRTMSRKYTERKK
ncbi:hypothetical protein CLAIMM_11953 [Cladophialophora immunda]|nr:hypothetical protein CLAIMM_11953 [Cladophialophora immunda]